MVLFFGLAAMAAAIALSVVTYASTRSYLLGQRSEVAQRQAFNNAQLMRNVVEADSANIADLVTQIRTEQGGYAVVQLDERPGRTSLFYAQEPLRFTQSNLPPELLERTLSDKTSRQRFQFENKPYEAIGVAVPSIGLHYFEAFPVTDVENTLRTIQITLLIGVVPKLQTTRPRTFNSTTSSVASCIGMALVTFHLSVRYKLRTERLELTMKHGLIDDASSAYW